MKPALRLKQASNHPLLLLQTGSTISSFITLVNNITVDHLIVNNNYKSRKKSSPVVRSALLDPDVACMDNQVFLSTHVVEQVRCLNGSGGIWMLLLSQKSWEGTRSFQRAGGLLEQARKREAPRMRSNVKNPRLEVMETVGVAPRRRPLHIISVCCPFFFLADACTTYESDYIEATHREM